MALLHPGDMFPALTVAQAGGGSLRLPDALDGRFGVVLFYRGAWCPYCNAQLRAFQRAKDDLAEVGGQVVALSVDDEATTAGLIAKHGLEFGVGYGADARALAEATGAVVNDDPLFVQSTGVRPQPGRPGRGRRLLDRGHRTAGARRRDRRQAGAERVVDGVFIGR